MDTMINTKTVLLAPARQSGALTLPPMSSAEVSSNVRNYAPLVPIMPVWSEAQKQALDSLKHAVQESSVFASIVGPKGSGTSAVLAEVLSTSKHQGRICIAITNPHTVSVKTINELEETLAKILSRFSGHSAHVLFGIDSAHTATDDLFGLLNRFARSRERHNTHQVVLAGEPELWDRLSLPRYEILKRRFALRCSLPL